MVQSSVPMSMLGQMVVPRALVSSLSRTLMMHAMQSNNSTVMIGKVAHSKSARIVLRVLVQDSAAVVDSEVDVEVLEVDSPDVEVQDLAAAVVLEAVLLEAVVVLVGDMEVALPVVATTQVHLLRLQIPSPTTPLLALTEARSSTFET